MTLFKAILWYTYTFTTYFRRANLHINEMGVLVYSYINIYKYGSEFDAAGRRAISVFFRVE